MKRSLGCWAPVFLSVAASGCSSHTIRDGIWALSFQIERSENREPLPIAKREVRVVVGRNDDLTKPDVTEIAEISPLEAPVAGDTTNLVHVGRQSMWAEIETPEEHQPVVKIEHKDKDWIWQMRGFVTDSKTIVGTRFFARARLVQNANFQGTWKLEWLRDG